MELTTHIGIHKKKFIELVEHTIFSTGNDIRSIDPWFETVINLLSTLKEKKGSIFFIGNGASCSMSSHFAVDFTKNGGVPSFSLNEGTLLTCFSNDFSYETAYAEMLTRYMHDGDILVAISSSGSSKNIVTAATRVKTQYAHSQIVTFTGFKEDNMLRKTGHHNVYVPEHDYGFVESVHAYYLHMLIDMFIQNQRRGER